MHKAWFSCVSAPGVVKSVQLAQARWGGHQPLHRVEQRGSAPRAGSSRCNGVRHLQRPSEGAAQRRQRQRFRGRDEKRGSWRYPSHAISGRRAWQTGAGWRVNQGQRRVSRQSLVKACQPCPSCPAPGPSRAPRRSGDRRRRTPAGRFLHQQTVEVAQQRAAAGQHHAFSAMSGPEFRRGFSRAILTAETIWLSGSVSASRISLDDTVKARGMPSARLRPLTSISRPRRPGEGRADGF